MHSLHTSTRYGTLSHDKHKRHAAAHAGEGAAAAAESALRMQ